MIKYVIGGAFAVAILASVFSAGIRVQKAIDDQRLAVATAVFQKMISEANQAYADQKAIDDKELSDLRQEATTAPANASIAVKRDMAKRIGAIR